MSENAFVCILLAILVGGCTTCSVSEDVRDYRMEKIRLDWRIELFKMNEARKS